MKVLDIAIKDVVRSTRSMFAIGMMLVAPLMISGLIFLAFGGASDGSADLLKVQVGVVNLDQSAADAPIQVGETIEDMLRDESVQSWLTVSDYPDAGAAQIAVEQQTIGAAVIIPNGLTDAILAGNPPQEIMIIHDPTLSIGPAVVRNMIVALLDGISGGGIAVTMMIDAYGEIGKTPTQADYASIVNHYQDWYTQFQRDMFHNPDRAALVMVSPGSEEAPANMMAVILGSVMAGQMIFFAFYAGAYSMMSLLQEDEDGTLARLFTTPTNRTTILTGKFMSVFLIVILQGVVLMTAGHFLLGVHWGQPVSVGLSLLGQVFAATGLGVFLISLTKNTRQAGPVLGGGLTVLGMLGGLFTVGVPSMPESFTRISVFTPQGWVLKLWQQTITGHGPEALCVPLLVSLLFGAGFFIAGALIFRRRFA